MSDSRRRLSISQPPSSQSGRTWICPSPVPAHAIFPPSPPPQDARFRNDLRLRP